MSIKDHKLGRVTALAAAGLLATSVAACGESTGGSSGDGGTIKVGLLEPLTGPSAEPGQAGKSWAKVMQQQLTAEGGPLEGKKVEVITYDTKLDPATAASFARRLITRDGVVAISCCQSSAEALQVTTVAAQYKVPVLGGAVLPALTEKGKPGYGWYFRATPGQDDTTGQIVDYVAAQGWKRVAISYASVDYGTLGRKQLTAGLKAKGIAVVATTPIDPTATDATGQANKLKSSRPDAIVSWDYPSTTAVVVRDVRAAGFTGPFVSNWSAHNDALFAVAGKSVRNVFAHTVWNPDKPRVKELEAAYAKTAGTPPPGQQNNNEAQFEWLIGVGIQNALKSGGKLDGQAVQKGLLGIRDLSADGLMMGASGSSVTFGRPYVSAGGQNPYNGLSKDALLMEETTGDQWQVLDDAQR